MKTITDLKEQIECFQAFEDFRGENFLYLVQITDEFNRTGRLNKENERKMNLLLKNNYLTLDRVFTIVKIYHQIEQVEPNFLK